MSTTPTGKAPLVLDPHTFYLVGEDHAVSNRRRPQEDAFARQVFDPAGSAPETTFYWQEFDFPGPAHPPARVDAAPRPTGSPNLHSLADPDATVVPSRFSPEAIAARLARSRARRARVYDPLKSVPDTPAAHARADLLVLRAAYATACTVVEFLGLSEKIARVGTNWRPEMTAGLQATLAGLNTLLLPAFLDEQEYYRSGWAPTQFPIVNEAAAFVDVEILHLLTCYQLSGGTTEQEVRTAAVGLHVSADLQLQQPIVDLAQETGVALPPGADTLVSAEHLRDQLNPRRTVSMALAAKWHATPGIWKVGNNHVARLTGPGATLKVDLRTVNSTPVRILTQEQFEDAFVSGPRWPGFSQEAAELQALTELCRSRSAEAQALLAVAQHRA
ncbi:hypothetical protein [Kineosporia sp. NBRC 101731]|uniref:hypothetical protein n=1 Tax=Kineosporia sp. NBRC 101731 TaxID=3032199 RepID=UPI0024A5F997|nr:hypothetical protein [Kineosporia sp. NBRC 101731]GLY29694.1 hypothetical protein Kisp02_30590 [Kineosporia sp. NBRC 101731]